MGNGYKILWTDNALAEFHQTLKYLKENWAEKELISFVRKLDKRLNLISINPKLFGMSNVKNKVRKSVLTKNNTIYYLLDDDIVKILSLFDSRQNPDKLKL